MFKNFIFLVTLMVYILLLSCANEMLWDMRDVHK